MNTTATPFNLAYIHNRFKQSIEANALPAGSFLSVTRGLAALKNMRDDWRSLAQERGAATSVFQCYNWISTWCEHYAESAEATQIIIISGYHLGKLVFVWPLMKSSNFGVKTVTWLTSPSGQYGDALLADGYSPATWHVAALEMLKRCEDIDLIQLRHVREGTSFHEFAVQNMESANAAERAPFMDLSVFKTEQDYDARYTSQQRKRRKKIRKDLESFGETNFSRVEPGPASDRAIAAAIAEKNKWLSARGRINRVLKCPRHLAFLQSLARSRRSEMETVVTETTVGGKPVSWEIAFRHNGTHFAYITSHLTELTDYSPGRLHMHNSQVQALKDGMNRFDLMIPYDVHKESWCTGMIHTDDYFLALTWRGKLKGAIYLKQLRPVLRSIYYRLGPKTLKLISPLTKHFT
jgi:CelD/BcsL family acetyltransferase involved in cellulose biosynthesis